MRSQNKIEKVWNMPSKVIVVQNFTTSGHAGISHWFWSLEISASLRAIVCAELYRSLQSITLRSARHVLSVWNLYLKLPKYKICKTHLRCKSWTLASAKNCWKWKSTAIWHVVSVVMCREIPAAVIYRKFNFEQKLAGEKPYERPEATRNSKTHMLPRMCFLLCWQPLNKVPAGFKALSWVRFQQVCCSKSNFPQIDVATGDFSVQCTSPWIICHIAALFNSNNLFTRPEFSSADGFYKYYIWA